MATSSCYALCRNQEIGFSTAYGCPKRVKNRSWSFSGLATMIRIILMYYINCYSFLNNPDRDWENLIERLKEQPIQLSLFK